MKVIIIGGGAAGLMAAYSASCTTDAEVVVIEKNKTLGKKLLITGKGRCNLTNDCNLPTLISNIPVNGKFLYSVFTQFSQKDLISFFENFGVKLKVERGNRVFPASDKSYDVLNALRRSISGAGVEIIHSKVESLCIKEKKITGVMLDNKQVIYCDSVIICTGGLSYPDTGSTGDGYNFALQAGHNIIEPKASLVPLETVEKWCADVMGLSLRNIKIQIIDKNRGKSVYNDFGELLFTHFGVSGPVILSASAHMRGMTNGRYELQIDLKPALTHEQLDLRIQRDFAQNINKEYINSLYMLLPKSLIPVIAGLSGIDFHKKVNLISREERLSLVRLLKCLPLTVKNFRPIEEAIITSGGVNVSEIDPKTMESKLIKNLYFAGEVIDADAYTGGFNLQIAFSTGYVAGRNAGILK